VVARGVPAGLGSHVQWDRKLEARIGQAMLSIPAMKGVVVKFDRIRKFGFIRVEDEKEDYFVHLDQVAGGKALVVGQSVTFEPGGLHVMLMKLREPLARGATFPLALEFEDGGSIELEVGVLSMDEAAKRGGGAGMKKMEHGGKMEHDDDMEHGGRMEHDDDMEHDEKMDHGSGGSDG